MVAAQTLLSPALWGVLQTEWEATEHISKRRHLACRADSCVPMCPLAQLR